MHHQKAHTKWSPRFFQFLVSYEYIFMLVPRIFARFWHFNFAVWRITNSETAWKIKVINWMSYVVFYELSNDASDLKNQSNLKYYPFWQYMRFKGILKKKSIWQQLGKEISTRPTYNNVLATLKGKWYTVAKIELLIDMGSKWASRCQTISSTWWSIVELSQCKPRVY